MKLRMIMAAALVSILVLGTLLFGLIAPAQADTILFDDFNDDSGVLMGETANTLQVWQGPSANWLHSGLDTDISYGQGGTVGAGAGVLAWLDIRGNYLPIGQVLTRQNLIDLGGGIYTFGVDINKNTAVEIGLELLNGTDTVSFVWWQNKLNLGGNSDIWDIGALSTPSHGGQLHAELTIEVDTAGDSTATFSYTGIADPDGNPWSGSDSVVGVSSDDFAFDGLQFFLVEGNGMDIGGGFDNLSVEFTSVTPPPPDKFWANTSGGDWFDGPWVNGRPIENHRVVFGDFILANSTVFVDSDVTVNALLFDNDNSYAIAGTASLNLEPGTLGDPAIDATRGAHELQARVNLGDNSSADISAGASVEFVNRLNLNGHTLTKSGDGTLLINNSFNTGSGTLVGAGGVIGGGGTIGGNLNNSAGIVAPGNQVLRLAFNGSLAAVPEPSALALVLLANLALVLRRRSPRGSIRRL